MNLFYNSYGFVPNSGMEETDLNMEWPDQVKEEVNLLMAFSQHQGKTNQPKKMKLVPRRGLHGVILKN